MNRKSIWIVATMMTAREASVPSCNLVIPTRFGPVLRADPVPAISVAFPEEESSC